MNVYSIKKKLDIDEYLNDILEIKYNVKKYGRTTRFDKLLITNLTNPSQHYLIFLVPRTTFAGKSILYTLITIELNSIFGISIEDELIKFIRSKIMKYRINPNDIVCFNKQNGDFQVVMKLKDICKSLMLNNYF